MLLRKRDDGSISVISAVVFACLLLGIAALVVDVGQMYDERRQLQNGADESATAIAHKFAEQKFSVVGIDPVAIARAQSSKNAVDGVADVLSVKIVRNGATVFSFGNTTLTGSVYDCQPTNLANYVEVRNKTESGGLKYFFSPGEATISSCARASWSGLGRVPTLPITMSECEWFVATAGGDSYAKADDSLAVLEVKERKVSAQSADTTGCGREPANQFGPGAFGGLKSGESGCVVDISANGLVDEAGGFSWLSNCKTALEIYLSSELSFRDGSATVLYVPVHDYYDTGTKKFHITGLAAFVLTGYCLPGLVDNSWVPPYRGKRECDPAPESEEWRLSSSSDPFGISASVTSGKAEKALEVTVSVTGQPKNSTISYSFDSTASDKNTFVFDSPGSHIVTAKVTDRDGRVQTLGIPINLQVPRRNDEGNCLYGEFMKDLVPVGDFGGADFGTSVVKLVL